MAPDAAKGTSDGTNPSKSGNGGAGGWIGAGSVRNRKRGAEGVQGDRSVRQKSSSDEDGPASSSSPSISTRRDASPPRGAGPVIYPPAASEFAPCGETCEISPGSSSSPSHDASPIEDDLHIYRKKAFEDHIKSSRLKCVSREPRPVGIQPAKYLRSKSTSEASSSARPESPSSKSLSSKSYNSYCESATSDGSTSSCGKASAQIGGKRQSAQTSEAKQSGSPSWEDRFCEDGSKKLATDKSVATNFMKFLNGYTVPGEDNPYYPAQLKAMKDRGGCFELTIHFEHILKSSKPLALNILKR